MELGHAGSGVPGRNTTRRDGAPGFDAAWLHEVLQCVPEVASGAWTVRSCRVTGGHRHFRKRFVRGRIAVATGDGGGEVLDVLVKSYGRDRGGPGYAAQRALWDAGFRPPARHRVPRAYGYSPEHAALVQGLVTGRTLADHLPDDPDLDRAASAAADWLAALHGSEVTADGRPPVDDGELCASHHAAIAAAHPAEGAALGPDVERLLAGLRDGAEPLRPSHGDFHARNVFVQPASVAVIDHDTFGRREPAYDLGYAIAQLLIQARLRHGSPAAGARTGLVLLRRYREYHGVDGERIGVHVGRALVQSLHYELCVLHNARTDLVPEWQALLRAFAGRDEEAALAGLARDR